MDALAFARKNPHAVLATINLDGTPQLSPVRVGVDSQDRLVISTRETAMKTLNVRRDPRAWLFVLNEGSSATGRSLAAPSRSSACRRRWNRWLSTTAPFQGEHPDWDDYRAAMIKQRRCLIRITPTKAGRTVFGSELSRHGARSGQEAQNLDTHTRAGGH